MPKLAGTYYSETGGDIGSGSTRRESIQKVGWFAIHLDGDRVLLRALSADGIPTSISKTVSVTAFLSHYMPDEPLHNGVTLPLLARLRDKLEAAAEALDENATPASLGLDKNEGALFKALRIEQEHLPELDRKARFELALEMLNSPPDFGDVSAEHRRMANRQSIASRKDGRYDEAISLYNAMLRAAPDDTHIFFNVARVHFDKSDFESCRDCLQQALERDPGFEEARRFLDYLDRRTSPQSA